MMSLTESVEIVEVTWKIPKFGEFIPKSPNDVIVPDLQELFCIGGRLPPAYPQSKSPPVKLKVSVFKAEVKSQSEVRRARSRDWEAHDYDYPDVHGVRLIDAYPQSATSNVTYQWRMNFAAVSGESKLQSLCTVRGKLVEFKVFDSENKPTFIGGMTGRGDKASINLIVPYHEVTLFDQTDAEKFVDKRDGSLNIYFRMEVTCSTSELQEGMEFTELSSSLESLLKIPRNSDVEIRVSAGEGQTFDCHKGILAGRSEVFRAMFSSDMKEANEGVVEVEDILPKTMEHFLSFIYCGRFQDSSWVQSLPQLLYAADKYCVKSLKNLCDLHLILSVTAENVLRIGKLAKRLKLTKAVEDIRQFIAVNIRQVDLDPDSDTSNSNDPNFNVRYSVPSTGKCLPASQSTQNN